MPNHKQNIQEKPASPGKLRRNEKKRKMKLLVKAVANDDKKDVIAVLPSDTVHQNNPFSTFNSEILDDIFASLPLETLNILRVTSKFMRAQIDNTYIRLSDELNPNVFHYFFGDRKGVQYKYMRKLVGDNYRLFCNKDKEIQDLERQIIQVKNRSDLSLIYSQAVLIFPIVMLSVIRGIKWGLHSVIENPKEIQPDQYFVAVLMGLLGATQGLASGLLASTIALAAASSVDTALELDKKDCIKELKNQRNLLLQQPEPIESRLINRR